MKRDALSKAFSAAAAAVLFNLTQRVQRLDEVVQLDLKVLNYIRCASLVSHGGARLEGKVIHRKGGGWR